MGTTLGFRIMQHEECLHNKYMNQDSVPTVVSLPAITKLSAISLKYLVCGVDKVTKRRIQSKSFVFARDICETSLMEDATDNKFGLPSTA
ncbi:hypothetical protein IEQ34_015878 [Dendrobium chrysotoxum]|uniref:Uncharacterized protein n=1 Tax=Dendrobium chrysotoxum TaxID=161865 RepID=A0AAV7GHB9_DENCH|nr:hypothetical protein IEQ34_015878 [Dendrobium chrysotoxum]